MKNSGFTLPEIIIATTISVVVGGLLVGILVNNTGVFYKQNSIVSEGLGLNDSLSKIRVSIKQAQAVAVSYPESGTPLYTSSSTQLVLKIPTIDATDNIVANSFDYAVYFQDTTKLRYKFFPAALSKFKSADQILSLNVNGINFQYFNTAGAEVVPASSTKVKVALTLKQKAGAIFETNTATSEANLRND